MSSQSDDRTRGWLRGREDTVWIFAMLHSHSYQSDHPRALAFEKGLVTRSLLAHCLHTFINIPIGDDVTCRYKDAPMIGSSAEFYASWLLMATRGESLSTVALYNHLPLRQWYLLVSLLFLSIICLSIIFYVLSSIFIYYSLSIICCLSSLYLYSK